MLMLILFPDPASSIAYSRIISALCLVAVGLRAYIVYFLETRALNRTLKSIEYQKWTRSFAHTVEQVEGGETASERPCSSLYQYHSWWLVAVVVICSTSLIIISQSTIPKNLKHLLILGSYLLFEVVTRISVELTWRLAGDHPSKAKLMKILFTDKRLGFPSLGLIHILNWIVGNKPNKFDQGPSLLTYATQSMTFLSMIFQDPVYFPDDWY